MGQEIRRRTPGTLSQQSEPSWSTVAGTTMHLWLERHHIVSQRPAHGRRRLVVVLSALVAMAFGAGITLAFTGAGTQASPGVRPSDAAQSISPPQQATAYRLAAAKWIKSEVTASADVSCDPIMCQAVQQQGFPSDQLMVLSTTAPDPQGAELIIATRAIRDQFGTRLVSVYAPQVIARFGSGPQEIEIRYLVPGGSAAYLAQLARDRTDRVQGGDQLLTNKHVHASAAATAELRAGQVDPRLLVTLAQLAHGMAIQLVAFDASSPGEVSAVPWRGVEIGTAAPGGLSAIRSFWAVQQGIFTPAVMRTAKLANGDSVFTVRYGAPSPMGLGGN
ncbi:MAG: hypothetical protein M3Z75_13145 [Actinomycetota bacterium]|nr:hypothetical protein [Actinomycetota bacterium]